MKSNDPEKLSEYFEIIAEINSSEPGNTFNFSVKKSGLSKSLAVILSFILQLTCLAQHEKETSLNIPDSSLLIEKVYLQTDRDYYTQGDNIWFKAYLVEDPDLFLSYNSMNLHVELISTESEIIDSRIIRIEGGMGKGDFSLSDSLIPGAYIIRAYTNYMRNMTDIQIFEKTLMIFRSSAVEKKITDSAKTGNSRYDVKFFPEGGSLVSNITCSVAFKATDETGRGCNVSGDVFASTGGHITSFQTAHKGMGRFYYRPVDGLSYYAVIKTPDGKTIRKDLPQGSRKGFTLNVSDSQENGPLITIRTNQATLETLTDQVHFITVSSHKSVVSTLGFSINSISTSLRLPLDDLPDGIVQLTLINSDEMPLCERLIFHNRNKVKLEVRTDKSVYNKRSVVNVSLSLKGDSIGQDNAFISLSAAEAGFLNSDNKLNSNISSWFLLESDIRGIVEDPAQYFDPGNPEMNRNLDLLLCIHGWRDFKWKYEKPVFYPEYGITISGKVRNPASENQISNVFINAILRKEKSQLMMTSLADSSGKFSFEELDFTGSARLVATALSDKNSSNQLMIDTVIYSSLKTDPELSRISLLPGQDLIPEDKGSYAENEFILRRDLSKKFLLSDTILLGEVTVVGRTKRESSSSSLIQPAYVIQRVAVGIPDAVVKITSADERYSSFRDIIRKGISGVRVEVPNDVSESGIRIRGSSLEPLFMLDGTPVPYSMVGDFPVKWIERIDIMKSGGIATTLSKDTNNDKSLDQEPKYNGVISIITKPEEKRKEMMPYYNSVNRTIKGFDAPRIFYSPDYSVISEQTYLPDLRSTLKWDPDLIVTPGKESKINYYNNDKQGIVRILVEGITIGGIPLTGSVEYEVK
jgi:hypothetical protein